MRKLLISIPAVLPVFVSLQPDSVTPPVWEKSKNVRKITEEPAVRNAVFTTVSPR